jgi:predicted RNase H-like HicB family nuclease
VYVRRLPEGVWLATSDDIPGLFVEGDTDAEAREEALKWAKELLVDNRGLDPAAEVSLLFLNISGVFTR